MELSRQLQPRRSALPSAATLPAAHIQGVRVRIQPSVATRVIIKDRRALPDRVGVRRAVDLQDASAMQLVDLVYEVADRRVLITAPHQVVAQERDVSGDRLLD